VGHCNPRARDKSGKGMHNATLEPGTSFGMESNSEKKDESSASPQLLLCTCIRTLLEGGGAK